MRGSGVWWRLQPEPGSAAAPAQPARSHDPAATLPAPTPPCAVLCCVCTQPAGTGTGCGRGVPLTRWCAPQTQQGRSHRPGGWCHSRGGARPKHTAVALSAGNGVGLDGAGVAVAAVAGALQAGHAPAASSGGGREEGGVSRMEPDLPAQDPCNPRNPLPPPPHLLHPPLHRTLSHINSPPPKNPTCRSWGSCPHTSCRPATPR